MAEPRYTATQRLILALLDIESYCTLDELITRVGSRTQATTIKALKALEDEGVIVQYAHAGHDFVVRYYLTEKFYHKTHPPRTTVRSISHPKDKQLLSRIHYFIERNPHVDAWEIQRIFGDSPYSYLDVDDAITMLVLSGVVYDDHSRENFSSYRVIDAGETPKPLPRWAQFAADACGPTAGIPAPEDVPAEPVND